MALNQGHRPRNSIFGGDALPQPGGRLAHQLIRHSGLCVDRGVNWTVLVRDREVGGSNPLAPTVKLKSTRPGQKPSRVDFSLRATLYLSTGSDPLRP
jgi:hypothetical protein